MFDFFSDFLIPIIMTFGLAGGIGTFLVILGWRRRSRFYQRILENSNNSNVVLGDLASIIRQRYFIDHTPTAQKLIREEYTIQSNEEGVVDIVLQFPQFLPNLSIYDSERNKLSIMTNQLTQALLVGDTNQTQSPHDQELNDVINQMSNGETYVIWIKLAKPLNEGDTTIIELEYDVEKTDTRDRLLLTVEPVPHNVFYTMKKPEDHTFKKTQIHHINEEGVFETKNSWSKKEQDLMHSNETQDSITLTSKEEQDRRILLTYSFRPKTEIVALPAAGIFFLTVFAAIILAFQPCYFDDNCNLDPALKSLLDNRLEMAIFLITASLVLPRLVKNYIIRFRVSIGMILPVSLGIMIFLGLIK